MRRRRRSGGRSRWAHPGAGAQLAVQGAQLGIPGPAVIAALQMVAQAGRSASPSSPSSPALIASKASSHFISERFTGSPFAAGSDRGRRHRQGGRQQGPPPCHPGPDGPDRATHHLGHFGVAQLLHRHQQQGRPELLGQLAQGALHLVRVPGVDNLPLQVVAGLGPACSVAPGSAARSRRRRSLHRLCRMRNSQGRQRSGSRSEP